MTENVPPPGTDLCGFTELADGAGRALSWGSGKAAFGIILLRVGDCVTAYVNRCPHFQIPLDHLTNVTLFGEFVLCSHHYAAFRIADGNCVEGPCEGASLTPMPVAVVAGRIRIVEGLE